MVFELWEGDFFLLSHFPYHIYSNACAHEHGKKYKKKKKLEEKGKRTERLQVFLLECFKYCRRVYFLINNITLFFFFFLIG